MAFRSNLLHMRMDLSAGCDSFDAVQGTPGARFSPAGALRLISECMLGYSS